MDQFTPTELSRLMDYFAQELDPDEMILTERWIEARPDRKSFISELQRSRIDLGTDRSISAWNIPSRVESLSHTLSLVWSDDTSLGNSPSHQLPPPSVNPRGVHPKLQGWRQLVRPTWYTIGAVAASVFMVVSGWYLGARNKAHVPVAMYTYTTGEGERATIALPDGSTVVMNVASRIQVPTNYSADNRTINLTGEALFTVVPLPGEPFTVVSGSSTTRVLGTSFAVRHYDADSSTTVAVREGKVSVGSLILTANQAASVSSNGKSRLMSAELSQFAFEKGVLELNDVPFAAAIDDLNRWYNVEIRAGDSSLKTTRISGTFEAGSITDLVSILEFTFNVRVVRDGRTLTIFGGR